MDNFNVETASYKELQAKAKELGDIRYTGVSTDELRAVVAERLSGDQNTPPEFNRGEAIKFLEEHKVELTGEESDEDLMKLCAEVVNNDPELQKAAQKAVDDVENSSDKDKNDSESKETTEDEPEDEKEEETQPEPVQEREDLVFQRKTVLNVTTRIINGKRYKDVRTSDGVTETLTLEDFDAQVLPRSQAK
jgi:hypothetical protein